MPRRHRGSRRAGGMRRRGRRAAGGGKNAAYRRKHAQYKRARPEAAFKYSQVNESSVFQDDGVPKLAIAAANQQVLIVIDPMTIRSMLDIFTSQASAIVGGSMISYVMNKINYVTILRNETSVPVHYTAYWCYPRWNLNYTELYGQTTDTIPVGGIFYHSGQRLGSGVAVRGSYSAFSGDAPASAARVKMFPDYIGWTPFMSPDFCKCFKIGKVSKFTLKANNQKKLYQTFAGPRRVPEFDYQQISLLGTTAGEPFMFAHFIPMLLITGEGEPVASYDIPEGKDPVEHGGYTQPSTMYVTKKMYNFSPPDQHASRQVMRNVPSYTYVESDKVLVPDEDYVTGASTKQEDIEITDQV